MHIKILFFILCLSLQAVASEEAETSEKNKEFSPIKMFFILEGLAGVNSWMASESPNIYGGAAAVLFPLAGCEHATKAECTSLLVAAESLAIYNLSIDTDKKSKSEIFKSNMVAWHIFAGVAATSMYFFKDETKKVSFVPIQNGAILTYSQSF